MLLNPLCALVTVHFLFNSERFFVEVFLLLSQMETVVLESGPWLCDLLFKL